MLIPPLYFCWLVNIKWETYLSYLTFLHKVFIFEKTDHFYCYIDFAMAWYFPVLIQTKPFKITLKEKPRLIKWLESSSFPKAGNLRESSFLLPSLSGLDFTDTSIFAAVKLVFKYKPRFWALLLLLARKLESVLSLSLRNSEKKGLMVAGLGFYSLGKECHWSCQTHKLKMFRSFGRREGAWCDGRSKELKSSGQCFISKALIHFYNLRWVSFCLGFVIHAMDNCEN